MQFLARTLGRWPYALACVFVLAGLVLLPGLNCSGLWEPQERQLADKAAPRVELAKKQQQATPTMEQAPPKDGCYRMPPKDFLARSLTNRAMAWGRDHVADSDAGRRLPLALLGLLTVLAAAGIAMRFTGGRAGAITTLILLSMPLLVLQSRMLTSEIGTAAGGAMTLYGLVALGARRGLLGIIESVVAFLSLIAGLFIGFAAGGALLGVLVPIGAFAVTYGLGFGAVARGARSLAGGTLKLGGKIRPRWALGRTPVRTRSVLAWIEAAVAIVALLVVVLRIYMMPGASTFTYIEALLCLALLGHAAYELGRDDDENVDQLKALVATVATIGVASLLIYQLYSLVTPQPGLQPPQREVFHHAIVGTGCWSKALGAIWRPEDDLRYTFDSTFEQIAYGTFPWGILGPIAMFALMSSADRRRKLVGGLCLAWAGAAWVACEAFQRKVGFTIWAGFPALAIAIGTWFDGLLTGIMAPKQDADAETETKADEKESMPAGAILVGFFVAVALIDLGKDLQSFTERLTSLLVGGDQIAYPKASHLLLVPTRVWILVIGGLIGVAYAVAMSTWREDVKQRALRSAAKIGAIVALAGTLIFAAFWAFGWQPALARHLSSKSMFDTYADLAKKGDQLVIMGDMGDAPYDYAPTAKPEVVPARDQIVAALARANRVFAIAPQTELCQLHREIGGKPYFVLDDNNVRSILLSNRVDGTTDKNPLRQTILHAEPKNIPIRPKARIVFDGRIELIGWSMPKHVGRGDKFNVTMFYKILQPVGQNWKVLFHFDGPLRFNGDHDPINGRCQTSTWQPGDYIVDTNRVTAGGSAFSPGSYEVWTGFFTGSNPNWKNMTVSEAPPEMRDTADRVKITTITLD